MKRWIVGKDPRQYGFEFGLWTRQVVAELIAQKMGVTLCVTAVGKLLAQLDITCLFRAQSDWRRYESPSG